MEQYIPKAALVAEIEKKKKLLPWGSCASQISMECNCKNEAYDDVISLLDTIETKEVDLEKEVELWYNEYAGNYRFDWNGFAKHFFKLGMAARKKAQKGK